MKRIYLVRHGESIANAKRQLAGKEESLSEQGFLQADKVAERVLHLDVDTLFASDFLRARQTAQPISKLKNIPIIANPVFGEFYEPTEYIGLSDDDAEPLISYRAKRNAKIESDPDWRYSDGETVSEFMARIVAAREYLEEYESDNILVVSHAYFITGFLASILLRTDKPSLNWFTIIETLRIKNTGVSMLTFEDGVWQVVIFNDHAHFAE